MIINNSALVWSMLGVFIALIAVLAGLIISLTKKLNISTFKLAQLQNQLQQQITLTEGFRAQNQQLKLYIEELKTTNKESQIKLEHLQNRYIQLTKQHTQTATTLEQKEQHFAEQIQLFNDSRTQLKLEFEQLAAQIFDAKGKAFSEQANQSLLSLLTPFREQITHFRQKVEDIHHKETIQKTQLADELKYLKELNQKITQETHDLTLALKGDKKIQGNWGELILENVLERSGLQEGRDFQQQVRILSETGEPQYPDVIINLPQQKHLIIDAKVSLNAYIKAANADTEEDQTQALKEHTKMVGLRIKELAERYYYKSPDINAPELVIMFIPIEPAFIAAFKTDDTLFQKAIDQNILLATPTTLLASLTIVRHLWRLEHQSKNTLELIKIASKVYDKLRLFLDSMDDIEENLNKAQASYHKAKGQLVSGKGNLVKLVNDFLDLGVSVKSEISDNWKAETTLELNTESTP